MVSSELEPIYLRTVIRAVAGLGEPIELSGGVRAPSLTAGSGGVTPRSRCRRCVRVAEPKVRIRSPPAESHSRTLQLISSIGRG
jgi:hypothetical protein